MLLIANGLLALHNYGTSSWFITSSWDRPGSIPVHRPAGRHPRQAAGQRRHSPSCAACPGGQSSTQRCWCSRSGPTQPRHRLLLAPQDEQPGAQRRHSRPAGSALRGGPSFSPPMHTLKRGVNTHAVWPLGCAIPHRRVLARLSA